MSVIAYKNNPDLSYSLALKKIKEQDYLFAIKLLKEAAEESENPRYFVELAELYYRLGQYEESTATYINLADRIFNMEVAFAILHSHQAALGAPITPNALFIPTSTYFKLSRQGIESPYLTKIIKQYQDISLQGEELRRIDVKANKTIRKLEEARESAVKGDYSRAMIILDSLTDADCRDKVSELRTIVYFGAEDYDRVIEEGSALINRGKGNIGVIRSVLYSIYARAGKRITAEFRNSFNDYYSLLGESGDVNELVGLYELTQMVGYSQGAAMLIKKMEQRLPYDISVILTSIAYYAVQKDFKRVDILLKRASAVHSSNPLVSYFNCLRQESLSRELPPDAWLSVIDNEICGQYASVFVLTYHKKIMEHGGGADLDVLKTAIVYFDRERLKDILSLKEITSLPQYKELLIWGIQSPYLGIENKVVLIELFISKYPDTEKVFAIPTELGLHCTRLKGLIGVKHGETETEIYNGVYPNLIFTENDVDRLRLLKVIRSMLPLKELQDESLLRATAHLLYCKEKKYELQTELVAGTYQVSYDELKRYFALYSEN